MGTFRDNLRPPQGRSMRAGEGPLRAQVFRGQQETRGAGIIPSGITETEVLWMPFAEMN